MPGLGNPHVQTILASLGRAPAVTADSSRVVPVAEAVREALRDVALTSAYLNWARPVIVVLKQRPEGTRYEVKAYPFDMRDQFEFISDLTVRGKLAIARAGGVEVSVPVITGADSTICRKGGQ